MTADLIDNAAFRRQLLAWYAAHQRDLPWRHSRDPWPVLVSEVMLQQTRVEAAIPYFERFLARYPKPADFAAAAPADVLAAWAGLGYYSRARNLQNAARSMVERGTFPNDYESIRALPGVGAYTAAAVASIAFELPHAALDGNVARVIARLTNESGDVLAPDTKQRLQQAADALLHRSRPGDFNQALMELGALICKPRDPLCESCPVQRHCAARAAGRERELPVRRGAGAKIAVEKTLLLITRRGKLLLWQRPPDSRRLAGFYELPELGSLANSTAGEEVGRFRHAIVNHQFRYRVRKATLKGPAAEHLWWPLDRLHEIPLSTTANKAVPCLYKSGLIKSEPRA